MGDIIKILKIDRKGQRIVVKISGLEKPLFISEDILIEHKLVSGIVITKSQLALLEQDAEYYNCYNRAKYCLAMREHSIGELIRKLYQKGFSKNAIDKVIQKLKKLQLLDDDRYALKLAQKLKDEKPCGRMIMIAHLRKKLLPAELAKNAVDNALQNSNEKERAYQALEKRQHQYFQLELEDAKKKSYTYLARRGFSYEAAKEAFNRLATALREE